MSAPARVSKRRVTVVNDSVLVTVANVDGSGDEHPSSLNESHKFILDNDAVNDKRDADSELCAEENFRLHYDDESETASEIGNGTESNKVYAMRSTHSSNSQTRPINSGYSGATTSAASSSGSSSHGLPIKGHTNKENIEQAHSQRPLSELLPLKSPNLAKYPYEFLKYHYGIMEERNRNK